MKTIRIFIASSAELEPERKAFRDFLAVENDRLHNKGLYLELFQWEHFLDSVSQTSLQDEYNQKVRESDIIVCLFYTKAGKYTQLEFDTALEQFHKTGAPLIYTYFKTGAPEPDPLDDKAQEMAKFKKRLSEIGHFFTRFNNTEDLLLQFRKQLDMLEDKGLIKIQEEVQAETKAAVVQYLNIYNSSLKIGNQQATTILNIENQSGGIHIG